MKVWEMNPLEFDTELRELREDKNLTQAELAKAINHCSHSTIKDYERGYCLPNTRLLIDIARALGIDEIRIDTSRSYERREWLK